MNLTHEAQFTEAQIQSIDVGTILIYSDASNFQKWEVMEIFDGGFTAESEDETVDFWFNSLQSGWEIKSIAPVEIEYHTNQRGFNTGVFTDANGEECSIQESSRGGNLIWVGCSNPGVKSFGENGWESVELPQLVANNRMHLDRSMAAALWLVLKAFAETGELP